VNSYNSLGKIAGIVLLTLTLVIAGGAKSSGQSPPPADNKDEIDRLLKIYRDNSNDKSFLSDDTQYQRYLVYARVERSLMAKEEQQRIDKQADAAAGSGPTTSAVSKGSVPWLFGFAVEHGALTQSVNNNIITLRGNVANLIKAINAKDYVESYRKFQDNNAVNLVSRASFSVSFVANQNGSSATNTQNTLAGYSAHIDLYNHRDPRDKKYIADWAEVVKQGLTQLATSVGGLHDFVVDKHREALQGWQDRSNATLAMLTPTSSDDQAQEAIKKIADDYVITFGQLEDIRIALDRVTKAMEDYAQQKAKVIEKIENSPIFSVEYTNTRQSATTNLPQSSGSSLTAASPLPDLSNVNVIAGARFIARSQVTFNAGTTFFNSLPKSASTGSVRDWRLSGQIDIPLPEIPQIGKSTLTFSGLFLSLLEEPLGQKVLVNGVAESRTGNIGVFQAKFSLPIKGAGLKIPISLTTSNRTELIKERDTRGTIGITLDLDSIFAKSSGGQ
jgi:hypothetical protein